MRLLQVLTLAYTLILCSNESSLGQSVPALPTEKFARFYGGVGGFVGKYRIPYANGTLLHYIAAPVLTVGYQITPRLAIQISGANYNDSHHYEGEAYDRVAQKVIGMAYSEYERGATAVPVLFRYTLSKKSTHRVQFDALAGISFLRTNYRDALAVVDSIGTILSQSQQAESMNQNVLTLGLGVKIRLIRHLDFVGDVEANRTLSNKGYLTHHLQVSCLAGLRYRFLFR